MYRLPLWLNTVQHVHLYQTRTSTYCTEGSIKIWLTPSPHIRLLIFSFLSGEDEVCPRTSERSSTSFSCELTLLYLRAFRTWAEFPLNVPSVSFHPYDLSFDFRLKSNRMCLFACCRGMSDVGISRPCLQMWAREFCSFSGLNYQVIRGELSLLSCSCTAADKLHKCLHYMFLQTTDLIKL